MAARVVVYEDWMLEEFPSVQRDLVESRRDRAVIYVVRDDDLGVLAAGGVLFDDTTIPNQCFLWVNRERCCQFKVARRLWEELRKFIPHLMNTLKEEELFALVRRGDEKAHAFARRFGFEPVGEILYYAHWAPGYQIYRKDLRHGMGSSTRIDGVEWAIADVCATTKCAVGSESGADNERFFSI